MVERDSIHVTGHKTMTSSGERRKERQKRVEETGNKEESASI
jgi:hypothetical protein